MRESVKRKRGNSIESQFLQSVIDGDIDFVTGIMSISYLDVSTHNRDTVLHCASDKGYTEMVRLFLSKGANVHIRNKNGMTPLHLASAEGHIEIVKLLLEAKSDIDALDYDRMSALHLCSQNNHVNLVSLLMERGANIYQKDLEGVTALHLAIYNNNIDVVNLFFQKMDNTLLMNDVGLDTAVESGHAKMVEFFYDLSMDIKNRDIMGTKMLWIAIKYDFVDVVDLLINQGVTFSTLDGYHEIMIAVKNKNYQMVQLLIDKGANINTLDYGAITPLHIAIKGLDECMVYLLISGGANIHQLYENKVTPLHLAVRVQSVKIVKLLLDNGANVNSIASNGFTPLHMASAEGHKEIINCLLEYSAEIELQNACGSTALRIAFLREHYDSVELLIENGAHIYDRNSNLMFSNLDEISNTSYNYMHSKYIASRLFYNQDLRTEDRFFIESNGFCHDYVVNNVLQMRDIAYITSDVMQCVISNSSILPSNELIRSVLHFLTITEMTKICALYTSEVNSVIKSLLYEGCVVRNVEKDGNCFFRAVAIALDQEEGTHYDLRSKVIEYIKENRDQYLNFVKNLDSYIRIVEQPGIDADNLLIQATADTLHRNIDVYRVYHTNIKRVTSQTSVIAEEINLFYIGNHYMAILPLYTQEQDILLETEANTNGISDLLSYSNSDNPKSPVEDTIETLLTGDNLIESITYG